MNEKDTLFEQRTEVLLENFVVMKNREDKIKKALLIKKLEIRECEVKQVEEELEWDE